MALTATVNIVIGASLTSALDLSTSRNDLSLNAPISFANGTGANQANMIFQDSRTLADGANETLDLYASGALLDPFGTLLTLTKLKFVYIENTSTDASLLVGGGTTPVGIFADASDILTLPPGGKFIWSAPNADGITITTNKNLKLEHNGTGSSTLTYKIVAIGID
ncbi:MAG: hypothetical protein ABFE01_14995 [Phycisphaerales bacterium]